MSFGTSAKAEKKRIVPSFEKRSSPILLLRGSTLIRGSNEIVEHRSGFESMKFRRMNFRKDLKEFVLVMPAQTNQKVVANCEAEE